MAAPRPEYWFYHVEGAAISDVLASLLEKTLQRGWRALVRCRDSEELARLDEALWTYRDDAFLPHGRADGPRAQAQPVLLTLHDRDENSAQAQFLLDAGAQLDGDAVERVVILFEDTDEAARQAARERWRALKSTDAPASYWRRGSAGRWEKQ